jgi:hypothetical protein
MAGSTCGYGDATVTEYADAASLSAGLAAIGTTTSVNFVGAAPKNGYTFEGSSFPQSTLMFDDNYLFNGSGGGTLYVVGNGYASGAFGIGTGEAVLYDDNSGNGIDIKFPTPVSAVGLIIGDPSLTPDSQAPGVGGFASFNLLFSGGATDVGNIGTNSELPLTGGTSPNFYEIQSTGTGITEINFSDNGSTPTIDTVAYATPEPSYYWLVGLTLTVFLGVRFMRKHKPSFARRALGAAPVAVVAGLAMFAAPVHSFAQVNCNLAVPNNPLTALGLGSVYLLTPGDTGCSQSNNGVQAFVQAAIYDPTAHAIYVYNPLVADGNSGPPGGPPQPAHYAISPIVPKLPSGAVVAIWFGFNGQNLTLTGSAVKNGTCVTGFGQFGYCNTTNFWNAVNADPYLTKTVGSGVIIPAAVESRVARDPRSTITPIVGMVPNRGTANDGLPCPTSRSYSIVDQDPSDNLTATFLLTTEATPREAQNTAANQMKLTNEGIGFNVQINPSDEAVLDKFVDPALSNPAAGKNPSGSCMPWLAKDLSDPTGNTYSPSLALNELQANVYGDPALVSLGDTFTLNPPFTQPPTPGPFPLVGTSAYNAYVAAQSLTRTNQYRAAVNQPLANSTSTTNTDGSSGDASFATFCKGMFTYTVVGDGSPADLLFNQDYQAFTAATGAPGAPAQPFPGMDESLFGFLANRFAQSYDFLGCAAVFNKPNPVTVVLDSMRLVSNSTYYVTPPFTAGP